MAASLAHVLGFGFSLGMRTRRTMIGRHLRRVYDADISRLELELKVQQAFDSYARYWVESFRLATATNEDLEAGMSWEGADLIDAALAEGKGAILALPHLGGWDFAGAWFGSIGYRVTVVVEALDPPELFEWFRELRERAGLTVVAHGPAAAGAVLRALRANELVALVSDRDLARTGVEVDFFGERTTLPAGPATLAIRSGAPILPLGIYFTDSGHHGLVRPRLAIERTGRLREDVARITQALARELEELIRRAPEQWHLLQPNWPSDYELLASGE